MKLLEFFVFISTFESLGAIWAGDGLSPKSLFFQILTEYQLSSSSWLKSAAIFLYNRLLEILNLTISWKCDQEIEEQNPWSARFKILTLNPYRRKRPKVDASIFDSALSHTRRSDASEKEKKIACPLLDVFACGQVSSPRLYRSIWYTINNQI